MAFGSDWPVVSPSALAGVAAAVHRTWPGRGRAGPHAPEEALSLDAALGAATAEGAAVAGLAAELGSLAVRSW
jgi:predicted amidohydrolase YtcJ